MDIVTRQKRSEMMSSVKSRGNESTELKFLSLLKNNKITGWRRHYKVEGKPDFAFPKLKLAVFIDGSFWHGGPEAKLPKSNTDFWETKIRNNKLRDQKVTKILKNMGWCVLRIWDDELKKSPNKSVGRLKRAMSLCHKKIRN